MKQFQAVNCGESSAEKGPCCSNAASPSGDCGTVELKPVRSDASDDVCCGNKPPAPKASRFELPGYEVCPFVEDFETTGAGQIPRVKTFWEKRDWAGAVRVRLNLGRNDYKVSPGLYSAGKPGEDSPVLVTANYKLTFDCLRKELGGTDAWILVVDTRGINVWCAAGKKTFSTEEVVERVKSSGLEKIVRHKKIVLPQLAATGVSALAVKKRCGFRVVWGPVRVNDIRAFLNKGMKAEPQMRRVTFALPERIVLMPVEISQILKPALWTLLVLFILSGIGPGVYSITGAWNRGLITAFACFAAVIAGAVATPALLPRIPGKAFSLKGGQAGVVFGLLSVFVFRNDINWAGAAAIVMMTAAISSYLAMNFTGSTPYTSPSGVEKEMKKAIPIQIGAALIGIVLWIISAFPG